MSRTLTIKNADAADATVTVHVDGQTVLHGLVVHANGAVEIVALRNSAVRVTATQHPVPAAPANPWSGAHEFPGTGAIQYQFVSAGAGVAWAAMAAPHNGLAATVDLSAHRPGLPAALETTKGWAVDAVSSSSATITTAIGASIIDVIVILGTTMASTDSRSFLFWGSVSALICLALSLLLVSFETTYKPLLDAAKADDGGAAFPQNSLCCERPGWVGCRLFTTWSKAILISGFACLSLIISAKVANKLSDQ